MRIEITLDRSITPFDQLQRTGSGRIGFDEKVSHCCFEAVHNSGVYDSRVDNITSVYSRSFFHSKQVNMVNSKLICTKKRLINYH